MGVSTDYLIDIGLNIAGFLAAGLLTVLIYSMLANRKKKFKPPMLLETAGHATIKLGAAGARAAAEVANVEFIDLSRPGKKSKPSGQVLPPQGEYKIRDRHKILQEAKRVIAQKKEGSKAKLSLPITEGEIAFIEQNLNNKDRARNK